MATLEELATTLAEAQAQLSAWTDVRKATIEQLEALHAAGQAPEKFKHAGISYSRQPGRTTYDYSDAPEVLTASEALKSAQEVAKATGVAIAKSGAPTWRVTAPKGSD